VIAEYEREKIKTRTLAGKRAKARAGLVVSPGNSPFGYRPDPQQPGGLQVHEPEAAIVRRIYGWVIQEHQSIRAIVAELRRSGARSTRSAWGKTQVRRILSASTYVGQAAYNGIAIPVPAIVTVEQHAAVRAQLARNREALVGRPGRAPHLLRGLLICATCGRKAHGGTARGQRRYQHREQDPAAPCSSWFAFQAAALEATVRHTLTAALRDPAVLRAAVARWEATRGATDVELRSRVAHLQKQIEKIRKDERRLIELAVGDGEQQGLVESKLRDLARARGGLTEQLREAEARVTQHAASTASPEAIERLCATARRGLDRLTAEGWRALLGQLVDEIRVNPDRTLEIRGLLDGAKLDRPCWPPAAGSASPAGTAGISSGARPTAPTTSAGRSASRSRQAPTS
jgi:site-specific DNA recombinase